ncbi:putative addiction module killer protein [Burkholderia pseudomallei TSV44]|nr:putative addiction module killer protein [Burkholderia pseudomallei TSV44]
MGQRRDALCAVAPSDSAARARQTQKGPRPVARCAALRVANALRYTGLCDLSHFFIAVAGLSLMGYNSRMFKVLTTPSLTNGSTGFATRSVARRSTCASSGQSLAISANGAQSATASTK